MQLEFGWDGYSGIPVNEENADCALNMIEMFMTAGYPEPSISPDCNGCVKLEWAEPGFPQIELYIKNTPNS